jgi:hypothetical protein
VDISQRIESDASAYLFIITIMNLAVGVATGVVMALCGLVIPRCEGNTDAARSAFHDKPGADHPRADVLLLDVGVPGVILATPTLAITKIVCERIRPLMAFGHFIEG